MGMLNGLFRLILGFSSGLIIAGSFFEYDRYYTTDCSCDKNNELCQKI